MSFQIFVCMCLLPKWDCYLLFCYLLILLTVFQLATSIHFHLVSHLPQIILRFVPKMTFIVQLSKWQSNPGPCFASGHYVPEVSGSSAVPLFSFNDFYLLKRPSQLSPFWVCLLATLSCHSACSSSPEIEIWELKPKSWWI